jgi:holo-[acyl-carrier protein] synthase
MIVGHGIDLVAVSRVQRLLDEHPDRFASRCFTPAEQAYCDGQARRRAEHYAARFAAKEAAVKALGSGVRGGVQWTDVEVVREPTGRPTLVLAGRAAELAASAGVGRSWVSLSHTDGHAIASVVLEDVAA